MCSNLLSSQELEEARTIFLARRERINDLFDLSAFQILGYVSRASKSKAEEEISVNTNSGLRTYSLPDSTFRENHALNCKANRLQFEGMRGSIPQPMTTKRWEQIARRLLANSAFQEFRQKHGGFWWDLASAPMTKYEEMQQSAYSIPGMVEVLADTEIPNDQVMPFIQTVFAVMDDCSHLPVRKCQLCKMDFLPTGWTLLRLRVGGSICPMCCHIATDWRQVGFWLAADKEERLREIELGLRIGLAMGELLPAASKAPQYDSVEALEEVELGTRPPDEVEELFLAVALRPKLNQIRYDFESWEAWVHQLNPIYRDSFPASQRVLVSTDGHICFSKGELEVCEFLHRCGFAHSKEPPYADLAGDFEPLVRHFVGDFRVGRTILEFAGLSGSKEYDQRLATKLHEAEQIGIHVIVITPDMLGNLEQALTGQLSKASE